MTASDDTACRARALRGTPAEMAAVCATSDQNEADARAHRITFAEAARRDVAKAREVGGARIIPAFSWDTEGAGWGGGRWSCGGIVVDHAGGHWFIDDSVRATVRAYATAFPALFAGVDLSGITREFDRYAAFDAVPGLLTGSGP